MIKLNHTKQKIWFKKNYIFFGVVKESIETKVISGLNIHIHWLFEQPNEYPKNLPEIILHSLSNA